jgi:glycosyltransferase involved in cell wall biosynthesis
MAARNAERYLSETMDSLLAQSFAAWEFIAIDDGSTDGTHHILQQYAEREARVRIITQQGAGLAASLNNGIAAASGKYIARIDADDIAMPQRLEKQVEWLDAHPDVHVLGTAALYLADGQRTNIPITVPTEPGLVAHALQRGNCLIHPAVMMRTEAVRMAGGYRACFIAAQDYDLWLRMAERGNLANLAEPLIYYRFHAEQAPLQKLRRQVWGVLAAQHAAAQRKSGEVDPLDDIEEITQDVITRLGLASREPRAIADAFESRIATHLLLGQRNAALDYGDALEAEVDASQWRSLYQPRLRWQLAVDALRHKRFGALMCNTVSALSSQPSLLPRVLRRIAGG